MDEFDIRTPLPEPGTTLLLEASAGTGKTWTIAALVARYVAEGRCSLSQMLVVTFTRAASQELRQRVRERLNEVERVLGDPASRPVDDELVAELVEGRSPDELAVRRSRVRAALADFDAAAIVTIHQFCQMVLKGLGVAGDTDAHAHLVEDLDDLLVEVVDDLYLRDYAHSPLASDFPRKTALDIARRAVHDPRARLEPATTPEAGLAGLRVAFCEAVRTEIDVRKRRLGVLSYDDLLGQLADALEPEDAPARHRMRGRWEVVLIDEFQDTDPVQWQVFDRAFSGHSAMVLIGDPKQAIYAFRGGDVFTYLEAKGKATALCTLGTNRRSDEPLLDATQALLRGAELGDAQIVVHDVRAAHRGSRLVGLPTTDPFRLRAVPRERFRVADGKAITVGLVNDLVAGDLAADIKQTLLAGGSFDGRPLEPRDIAVLAHKRRHLEIVQQALAGVGVPAVISGGGSIFRTPAATEWLTLLEALEQPHRSDRVRAAALTSFFGYSATELTEAGEELTERVGTTIRDWIELLGQRGVAAVFETAVAQRGLMARVLGRVDGERLLTDLQHLAQSLHRIAVAERMGPVALLAWLHEQISEDVEEVASDRTRRLDSDALAVQLVTIHGSKGLQYPLVYLPFAADRWTGRAPETVLCHDDAGRRVLDVGGGTGRSFKENDSRARAEDAAESLRTLYVAMTRAQCQLTVWWAPGSNASASPLNRLVFGRQPGEGPVRVSVPLKSEAATAAVLDAWQLAGAFRWSPADPVRVDTAALPRPSHRLVPRLFAREVDTAWRRTSYTALSSPAAEAGTAFTVAAMVGSEPEFTPRDDEAALTPAAADPGAETSVDGLPSPLGDFEAGAQFGSLVHAVLEHADPQAPAHAGDLAAELLSHAREQLVRWPVPLEPEALAAALVQVCDSPLGPLAADRTLRDIGRSDRLCELDFELPLGGGDRAGVHDPVSLLADVAPLLRQHLSAGDPVREWALALDRPVLGQQELKGYLTGSVDVVLRVPDHAGDRYLVVDYKTNWLGPLDQPLTSAAYTPAALHAAMGHSSYPLQALLYAVVLHRFLRWRLPAYDPERHLGGVLYLYVRGMCGPATPVVDGEPCGVFSWRPPVALVTELSDLLDGPTRLSHIGAVAG